MSLQPTFFFANQFAAYLYNNAFGKTKNNSFFFFGLFWPATYPKYFYFFLSFYQYFSRNKKINKTHPNALITLMLKMFLLLQKKLNFFCILRFLSKKIIITLQQSYICLVNIITISKYYFEDKICDFQ